MSEKVYVVTLYKYEDLEDFYTEMESNGFRIHLKRPISRNTHYWMTDEQAVELRKDSRVWDVQLTPEELGMTPEASGYYVNTEPYTVNGQFWKDDTTTPTTIDPTDYQWGHIHCAGTTAQRRKGTFGTGNVEKVTDTVEIFNSGRHVDVVICDDPVSYDCAEWESPSNPGTSRFVQYDWFNELNQYVSSIDDDNQTLPTGTVTYHDNANNSTYHGTHVAGTVAGQHYGWAREANIYGLQVLGTMPSGQSLPAMLIFDYLRAFHRYKPINPATGKRNPTVCNHSWGYGYNGWGSVPIAEINNIYDSATGNNYNSGNPNPSGWTQDGINKDFGVGPRPNSRLNAIYTALEADATDAMEEGVIQVGAANNNNQLQVHPSDSRYDSTVTRNESIYPLYKGSAPTNAPGFICVGALENADDFRRATYTNYGPRVDIFAPGSNIVSAFGTTGIADTKYGGNNYYYPIGGTSMASPQVCGVLACVASGKDRFTNDDAIQYLLRTGLSGDMTFDIGGTAPATFAFDVPSATFSDYFLTGSDRVNTWTTQADPDLFIYEGDTITFNINNLGSHPFEIRSALGGPAVPGVVNNGATNGLIEWDTTGVTPGTYYYQCTVHSSMNGQINVQSSDQGSQADNTCQQGSPNLELRAVNERQDVIDSGGFVDHLNFTRRFEKSNQLYPRRKSIFIADT